MSSIGLVALEECLCRLRVRAVRAQHGQHRRVELRGRSHHMQRHHLGYRDTPNNRGGGWLGRDVRLGELRSLATVAVGFAVAVCLCALAQRAAAGLCADGTVPRYSASPPLQRVALRVNAGSQSRKGCVYKSQA